MILQKPALNKRQLHGPEGVYRSLMPPADLSRKLNLFVIAKLPLCENSYCTELDE